jgi:transcriptional regulator with XRE-family HTH domain
MNNKHHAQRRRSNPCFARLKLGLSQQQLADSLGVSRSMIAMVETGKRNLPSRSAQLYLQICDKAKAINPLGMILVKRGRKPARHLSDAVTNWENAGANDSLQPFTDRLRLKKEKLQYQCIVLECKREATQERSNRLAIQLGENSVKLEISTKLFNLLPEGRQRDKHELLAAVTYARQLRLQQQLRRYSPVILLQIEFAANKLATHIALIDETMQH